MEWHQGQEFPLACAGKASVIGLGLITTYLKKCATLGHAQQLACHEAARTTGLYDRRDDEVSLDEIERILI